MPEVRYGPNGEYVDLVSDEDLQAASKRLDTLIEAVLEWARTPGPHGGNPYCHEFVRLAEEYKAD